MKKSSLTLWQLAAFAAPSLPLSALHSPITVYLPPFYAGEMGLGLATVGTIFMLARLWDIITDPVMGVVSDRFPTRYGRRRHWLVLSVPILLVSVAMVFMPRTFGGQAVSAAYLLFWMFVLYIGYTLATLSQFSWAAELTGDYHERSRILGWWEFGRVLGMFLVLAVPAFVEQYYNTRAPDSLKVSAMGWFFVLLLPVTVAFAVTRVPERPTAPPVRLPWRQAASILARNRLMLRVLGTDLMIGVPGGLMGALYVFYVSEIIEAPQWISVVLLGFFFSGLLSIPLTLQISYRIGKHQTLIVCMLAMIAVTTGFLFLGAGDLVPFAILIALSGLVFSGISLLLRAITADITDYDNLETGSARSGLYYALLTMTNKLGYALAVGITYPWLQWMGFVPGGENTAAALDALRYTFVGFPIVALVIGIALMYRFPLDAAWQRELRSRVEERDARLAETGSN